MNIFKGIFVFTKVKDNFNILHNGYILVENGTIIESYANLPEKYNNHPIVDYTDMIIIPGFVDLHTHASQYANLGLGLDLQLIPWLNKYTFVEEAKFSNIDYAKKIYSEFLNQIKLNGTTSMSLFASVHLDSSNLLVDLLHEKKLKGCVGKVNMDINCPDYIRESTKDSIKSTIKFVETNKNKYKDISPIITPRFIPTCSEELLTELGNIAQNYDVPIQSHIDENLDEIKWVKELYPDSENYSSVYSKFNLLNKNTLMAHCVHMSDKEISEFKKAGTFAIHCPLSNTNIVSGISPVKQLLDYGINVGLGTDISGGSSLSMIKSMQHAIHVSKLLSSYDTTQKPLTSSEVFYMATKGGGKFFNNVGSFELGYKFDALIIDDTSINTIDNLSIEQRIDKLIYQGDDRNISKIYVNGIDIT